jgi:hypothetical protein
VTRNSIADEFAARVRLWCSLRDLGAVSLRDGVSLIPASNDNCAAFGGIVQQIERTGGSAWVFELQPQPRVLERRLMTLFDRTASYQQLRPSIDAL